MTGYFFCISPHSYSQENYKTPWHPVTIKNYFIIMGSTQSEPMELRFIQVLKDRYFGTIKVYRQFQRPYNYYMKLLVNLDSQDSASANFLQAAVQILSQRPRHDFLPHLITPAATQVVCGQTLYLLTLEYLNFTLADLMAHLAAEKTFLTEAELSYIVSAVLSVEKQMEKYGVRTNYTPHNLFLDTCGHIVVYPFALTDQQPSPPNCSLTNPKSRLLINPPLSTFSQNLCQLLQALTTGSPNYNSYWNLIIKVKKCRNLQEISEIYPWESRSSVRVGLPGTRDKKKQVNQLSQLSRQTTQSYSTREE